MTTYVSRKALMVLLAAGTVCAAGRARASDGFVRRIKVLADKAPDCTSRASIVRSVTRGCTTNDEKAIAIYNFCKLAWYHRQYPNEPGGVAALKMINVYGWSLCGGQHSVLSSLWVAAGWRHRFVGWPGHTTVEVQYDGRWHYFDTFLKFYCWRDDPNAPDGRTVASQAEIAGSPDLVRKGLVLDGSRKVYFFEGNRFEVIEDEANWTAPALLVCGDGPGGVIGGCKRRNNSGSPAGWAGINHEEKGYTTDVDLGPGMSLELMWKALPDSWYWRGQKSAPGHTCGDKEFRNCPVVGPILEPYIGVYGSRGVRTYANGVLRFAPDLSSDAFLAGLAARKNVRIARGRLVPADSSRSASITIPLASPYVFVKASGRAEGVDRAEVSTDGGKSFAPVEFSEFSSAVKGRYGCLLRLTVEEALKSLHIEVVVQHNRCALPYLSPGKNTISVSVGDRARLGANRLCVTYAYARGAREVSYEQLADRGWEVARGHKASWSDTPTVVQKMFAARDLPATFDIDVPTPSNAYPVYPRMLFLRREVLAPGQEPLPLPEGAAASAMGPRDELKTLPNPFLMGTARPPQKKVRPTTTRALGLRASHVVDHKGGVYDNHYVKTRPGGKEWWVMLIGGSLEDLPAAKDIAAARLVFPVTMSHAKANTKVGVLALNRTVARNAACGEDAFGDVLGTAVIPKRKARGSAKKYAIDVSRYVKAVASGEARFRGFAVKVLPDRGVDDGWTVRIDIAKSARTYLEVDVYAEARE